jgi:hypothetical protein
MNGELVIDKGKRRCYQLGGRPCRSTLTLIEKLGVRGTVRVVDQIDQCVRLHLFTFLSTYQILLLRRYRVLGLELLPFFDFEQD